MPNDRSREIPTAPNSFDGVLDELFDKWINSVLIDPSSVSHMHRLIVEYCGAEDPLFLVRSVRGLERRKTCRTDDGTQLKGTDNAPAWWVHAELFQHARFESLESVIHMIPTHMFDVQKVAPKNINRAGWYVAHIQQVKDGNVEWKSWNRSEVVRRFVRNIHPCNYFYVPKVKGTALGENDDVIAYMAHKYADLYSEVWEESLELCGGMMPELEGSTGSRPIRFHESAQTVPSGRDENINQHAAVFNPGDKRPAVVYHHPRLCFRRDLIGPLRPDERFRVETKEGVFEMSKAEFELAFANVVASKSYRIDGVYHYPRVPKKALPYQVANREAT